MGFRTLLKGVLRCKYGLACFALVHIWGMGWAQPIKLQGTLHMATGEAFPYSLELTVTGNKVSGYAYTFNPPNDTKAAIEGTIDKNKEIFNFQESIIVYSHALPTTAFMCLIHAKLQVKNMQLIGNITGSETDNTACTAGTLDFTNRQAIEKLFRNPDDQVIEMGGRKKEHPAPAKDTVITPAEHSLETITAAQTKAYTWHSDSIVVDIWDGGQYDADAVNLYINNKLSLSGYILVKQPKHITIPISAQEPVTIAIRALNEGSDPPNTAHCILKDGTETYHLLAYNKKGETCKITITKAKN